MRILHEQNNMDSHFILIIFPASEKAITRMGVWREVYNGEVDNAVIADYSIWEMKLTEQVKYIESLMDKDKRNFVIFIPGTNIPKCIPEKLIASLKCMTVSPSAVVLQIIDSIERLAHAKKMTPLDFNKYFKAFDIIYTYDVYEASKYGFSYAPLPLKTFELPKIEKTKPKIFFIGRIKGRLDYLKGIATLCETHGINYEFLVLKEPNIELKDIGNIHFINYLKYDEVVKHIAEATCLLSIVSVNANMMPASYTESILYNKKLLTNCKFLKDLPFYNENYMHSFDTIDDIDISWLCDNENVDYHYDGRFSANAFLSMVEKDYLSGFLRQCAKLNSELIHRGRPVIKYAYHFSKKGWIEDIENAQPVLMQSQLEALSIQCPYDNCSVVYEVKQRGVAWQKATTSLDKTCGIIGKSLPITAIRLMIECSNKAYDISYRLYIKELGWTPFAHNNEVCGFENDDTNNLITGIQIILVNNTLMNFTP